MNIFIKSLGLIILLALFTAAVLFCLLDEKFYDKVMTDYISYRLTRGVTGFEDKVRVLRDFVHENINPVGGEKNREDTVAIDKLVSGIGWCDQKSRVFMQLAKRQGITTRLDFLLNDKGSSPHSIAEALENGRWILVDPSYNLELYNKQGQMATRDDLRKDFSMLINNARVKQFALYIPAWGEESFLKMYTNEPIYIDTRQGRRSLIGRFIPEILAEQLVCFLQNIYAYKVKGTFSGKDEYMLFRARTYHLLGSTERAEKLFRSILSDHKDSMVCDRARFFLALLMKQEKRYRDAADVLTGLIEDPKHQSWLPFAYGMRAAVYTLMDDYNDAYRDLEYFKIYSDAFF